MKFAPILVALTLLTAANAVPNTRYKCRCTSGQDCWPTQSDFQSLSSQVSQPLIYPVPPAAPCYPAGQPSGNCTEVQAEWTNGNWRSSHPGAVQNTNYETYTFANGTIEACYLNTTLGASCQQGSVSPIGVDARSPGDIQAGVKFAASHNLRLVIKNTGYVSLLHCFDRNAHRFVQS
jgi:hypothetical protein